MLIGTNGMEHSNPLSEFINSIPIRASRYWKYKYVIFSTHQVGSREVNISVTKPSNGLIRKVLLKEQDGICHEMDVWSPMFTLSC